MATSVYPIDLFATGMAMKENKLDVLIYLFQNYMFDDEQEEPDQQTLSIELAQAGFDRQLIDQAFDWLENLAQHCAEDATLPCSGAGGMRLYRSGELRRLSTEARGLLLSLEQCGVLNPATRELVVAQFLELDLEGADLDQLKWVIIMVLSNYNGAEGLSDQTEQLVMDGVSACLH